MKTELLVGKVVRPRGLKGEVKLELYADDVSLDGVKDMRVDGEVYSVRKISISAGFAFVQFAEVNDADEAEKLRGKFVYAPRRELPPLEDGRYYVADLIGMEVYAGDKFVGTLSEVLQYGAADVYVVKAKEGSVSFPALKKLLLDVDVKSGVMRLDEQVFANVAVYNP